MSNNRKERHHIVPQVYLRNFSDKKNQIRVANLITQENYSTNITNASVEDKFYTLQVKDESGNYLPPDYFEDWLGDEIEGPVKEVFEKILNEKKWPLAFDERKILTHFIVIQYLRGADQRDFLTKLDIAPIYGTLVANGRINLAKTLSHYTGHKEYSEKDLDSIWLDIQEGTLHIEPPTQNHIAAILSSMNDLVPYFADRIWHLVRYDNLKLITGDSPVIVLGSQEGFSPMDSPAILFPLSREVGLVMIHHKNVLDFDTVIQGECDSFAPSNSKQDWHEAFISGITRRAIKGIYCHPEDVSYLPSPLPAARTLYSVKDNISTWMKWGEQLRKSKKNGDTSI